MKSKFIKVFRKIGIALLLFILICFVAFEVSPWPSALLVRYAFNSEAEKTNEALVKHVPSNIKSIQNQQYDLSDKDAFLDVYIPSVGNQEQPVILWIHGGGLISGNKEQVSNYCKILSSKGFVVVAMDYTIAPEGKYPTPLIQTNKALSYIDENADRFQIDTSNIILAGDSGGAFIAAQVANTIYNKKYAEMTKVNPGIHPENLKGLLLYCGIYDLPDNMEGTFEAFMNTVVWSYFGEKDISDNTYAKTAFVCKHITSSFPPCFISAGNGDPLLSQSLELSSKLSEKNIAIDTLFYSANRQPSLPHEYQFTLDTDAGKQALKRSLLFLENVTNNNQNTNSDDKNDKTTTNN